MTVSTSSATRYRVLLADPIEESGRKMFEQAGAEVHVLADEERERLPELLADFDALVVRSRTKVNRFSEL